MGSPTSKQWEIKPTNLFRIYQPDTTHSALQGHLLLEIDNNGAPARSFRCTTQGEDILAITTEAGKISSLPGCEAFTLTIQIRPEEIEFRDNAFSGEWLDISDLVSRGKVQVTIDDTDHMDEYMDLVEGHKEKDHTKGSVVRWCINVSATEEIELCLQSLPISHSGIAGRPAFAKDICPGQILAKFKMEMDFTDTGPLRGPTPTLFAPDVDSARAAIDHNPVQLKTGTFCLNINILFKKKIYNSFLTQR